MAHATSPDGGVAAKKKRGRHETHEQIDTGDSGDRTDGGACNRADAAQHSNCRWVERSDIGALPISAGVLRDYRMTPSNCQNSRPYARCAGVSSYFLSAPYKHYAFKESIRLSQNSGIL